MYMQVTKFEKKGKEKNNVNKLSLFEFIEWSH